MTEILITSSVLILALLLLRKVFSNRLSRRVQYALWALVLVRLLLPVQLPAMDFSVLNAAKPVEEAVTRTVVERPIYVPVAQAPLEEVPATVKAVPEHNELSVGKSVWVAQEEQQTAVQYKRISPETILFWVWLAGCVTAAAFLLLTNLRFWLWLRKVRKPYEVENCKRRVYLVESGLPAPCLFGLFRPAIYLTPGAAETPESLRHVLAHEMTHARHLDNLWTFLRGVCLALYWFDPLVWAAAAAAKTDCELACDEGALARLEEEDRIPYGETLLSLAVVRETSNPMLAATAMTTGKQRLKERVTRIAHKSRQTIAAVVAVSLLVGAVSACTFSGGQEAETGPLRICVDIAFHSGSDAIPYANDANGAKFWAQMAASHIDGLDEDDIELEIIPGSGSERQTALTRIRTEIMSGEGPDVFLCACPDIDLFLDEAETVLFPFPERAMEEGIFLPLDKYLEKAEWMEWDKMLPSVTAAGKTDKGQMVIPVGYTMRMTAYEAGDAAPYPTDTSFADLLASDDPILRSTTAFTYRHDHKWDIAFPYLFADLADFKTGELTFTEEELVQMILDVETLFKENLVGLSTCGFSQPLTGLSADDLPATDLPVHFSEQLRLDTYGEGSMYELMDPDREGHNFITYETLLYLQNPRRGFHGNKEQVMLPLYNVDGGATALVASFAAVNANTKRPKDAFFLLDYLLSEYMHNNDKDLYRHLFENALPVRMDIGESSLGSEGFRAYAELREQIGYARFCSVLDQELAMLVSGYSNDFAEHGEEALRAAVSESYAKMKRILDES